MATCGRLLLVLLTASLLAASACTLSRKQLENAVRAIPDLAPPPRTQPDRTGGAPQPGAAQAAPVAEARALERLWVRKTGPVSVKGFWLSGVAAMPDGSFVMAGAHTGTVVFGKGGPNQTTLVGGAGLHGVRPFLARYDRAGELLWARQLGGNHVRGVVAFPDGSVAVVGTVSFMVEERPNNPSHTDGRDPRTAVFGAGTPKETRVAGCERLWDRYRREFIARHGKPKRGNRLECDEAMFVARYDSEGHFLGVRTAHAIDGLNPLGMTALPDGSLVVVGKSGGMALFGAGEAGETAIITPGTVSLTYSYDRFPSFLARFAADGSLLWARTLDDEGSWLMAGRSVARLRDGSLAVTGSWGMDSTDPAVPRPTPFVALFSDSGRRLWERRMDSTKWAQGSLVTSLPGGDLAMVGEFTGEITGRATDGTGFALAAPAEGQAQDLFMARYDARGGLRWIRQVTRGASRSTNPSELMALPDGSLVVAGSYKGTAVFGAGEPRQTERMPAGDLEAFVARYSPDGRLDAVFAPTGTLDRHIADIAPLTGGDLVLVGQQEESEMYLLVVAGYRFALGP